MESIVYNLRCINSRFLDQQYGSYFWEDIFNTDLKRTGETLTEETKTRNPNHPKNPTLSSETDTQQNLSYRSHLSSFCNTRKVKFNVRGKFTKY